MPCEDHQRQISQFIDGELALAEQTKLQKHLQQCSSCAEMYSSFQDIQLLYQTPNIEHTDISEKVIPFSFPPPKFYIGWRAAVGIFILGSVFGGMLGYFCKWSSLPIKTKEDPAKIKEDKRYPYIAQTPQGYLRIKNKKDEEKLRKLMQNYLQKERKKHYLNRYRLDNIPVHLIDYGDF